MSEVKDSINVKKIAQEAVMFSRKVNSLSKAVDFVIEEAMPAVFKEKNIEKVYRQYKKQLDYFMRHLV